MNSLVDAAQPTGVRSELAWYLEVSFAPAAGDLAALNESTATLNLRLEGLSMGRLEVFDETNDYSFDPSRSAGSGFSAAPTITAYIRGSLVWGLRAVMGRAVGLRRARRTPVC